MEKALKEIEQYVDFSNNDELTLYAAATSNIDYEKRMAAFCDLAVHLIKKPKDETLTQQLIGNLSAHSKYLYSVLNGEPRSDRERIKKEADALQEFIDSVKENNEPEVVNLKAFLDPAASLRDKISSLPSIRERILKSNDLMTIKAQSMELCTLLETSCAFNTMLLNRTPKLLRTLQKRNEELSQTKNQSQKIILLKAKIRKHKAIFDRMNEDNRLLREKANNKIRECNKYIDFLNEQLNIKQSEIKSLKHTIRSTQRDQSNDIKQFKKAICNRIDRLQAVV